MTAADRSRDYVIFVDGSSRGNPGQAGAGVLIQDTDGTVLLEQGYPLGRMTNNEAEYNALILGLEEALVLKAERVTLYADSELMVRQMNGQYRVKKPHLKALNTRANRLAGALTEFTITHVPRERNQSADRLAQQASSKAPTRDHHGPSSSGASGSSSGSLF